MEKTGHAHQTSQREKDKVLYQQSAMWQKSCEDKAASVSATQNLPLVAFILNACPHVFGSLLEPLYIVGVAIQIDS